MRESILKSFRFKTSTLKPKIKRLKNTDLVSELLPFYEELNVIKTDHAFRGYAII